MSSVESLREFVNERLTAAAEEIFRVFKTTIVQYEEEIDRQRKLLDICWKPQVQLHRIELPQQHVCKEEEVLADQQLCNQEKNSSLDPEDPEPPEIKEEQEELCTSQEGEQLVLKVETDTFMLTPNYEESDHTEPEPESDHQLLSNNCHVAESQDQKGGEHGDSGSAGDAEPEQKERRHRSKSLSDNVKNSNSEIYHLAHQDKKSFTCDTCGKTFQYKSNLNSHQRTHTELPQQHVCKEEEVLADQQLCNQERNSSLDQEDPEPPEIKEEQEELCTSQEGEQLVLKVETDTFMLTPNYEESDHTEPEPESDHQLLSNNCHVAESQDQKGGEHGDSGSAGDAEPEQKERRHRSKSLSDNVKKSNSEISSESKKSFECDTCGKTFQYKSQLTIHLRTHTSEKPYSCETCGKAFRLRGHLTVHMRNHTDEKPYLCSTCGKSFIDRTKLKLHMRIHTGEKPFTCKTCGKDFRSSAELTVHMRIHTAEKPYSCKTCEKAYRSHGGLKVHMRIHTGEKPFTCKTCGKAFRHHGYLTVHMRIHTGEKPYSCKTCEQAYRSSGELKEHMRRHHTDEKPYCCNTCGKAFKFGRNLKLHTRVHTREKPHDVKRARKDPLIHLVSQDVRAHTDK